MNIQLKLNRKFERSLKKLRRKYGEEFEILNGIHYSQTNFSDFIDAFIDKNVADVTIDANANASHKDIVSLRNEKGKSIDKIIAANKIFYELDKKYGLKTAKKWLEEEYTGAFYLHDFSSTTYVPYCYAYDLSRLAKEGLFFLDNYNNQPPKHLTTFFDNVIEFISFMSNRSSGAVGLPNVLVWGYWFWLNDCKSNHFIKDAKYYAKQNFQKLIYRLNQPFMRVDQSAFVNFSIFDREYYEALFGGLLFPDETIGLDFVDEFMEFQKLFLETLSEIREENMFTFPILTYSLLYKDGKFVDEEFARWCSDFNCKWNDANFFTNSDVTTLSNCCRLLSSTNKLKGFINSIGGTALSIGSVKVNTINLVHIFYEIEKNPSEELYLKILKERTKLCCQTLDVIRHIIKRNIEKGLLPNYCDGGVEMSKQYCTIGLLGTFELIDKFGYIRTDEFGNKYYTEEGIKLASKIFETIDEVKDSFTDEYSFNIESVPAERAAVNLCEKDNLLFKKSTETIYSNQWIPLTEKCTIDEKIRVSAILDNKCSGGAIAHINIESNFANKDMAYNMLCHIASKGVIYFCWNTKINVCENHHGFIGSNICPNCGGEVVDTYQRIVGFLTPSKSYSVPRLAEFKKRKHYDPEAIYDQVMKIE